MGRGWPEVGEGWFMVPMRAQKRKEAFHEPRLHRDNCLLQVQHRIVLASSWFRCAIVRSWKLPMNPLTPSLSPSGGEGGRRPGEGASRGSRAQCAQKVRGVLSWGELPRND